MPSENHSFRSLRPGLVHDVDALEQVVGRLATDARVWVGHRAQHVVVVLEHVGVDRAELDTEVGACCRQLGEVVDAVPRDVQRDRRRDAGESVAPGAASAIFSYGSRGTPSCAKTLNRVPELPNAHEGSSIRLLPAALPGRRACGGLL